MFKVSNATILQTRSASNDEGPHEKVLPVLFRYCTYDAMLPDAEIVRIATEVFEGLGWMDDIQSNLTTERY
jgi:hypothetical protein